MADITFTITRRNGNKAHGHVDWPTAGLSSLAVSGSSSDAAIDLGTWTARRAKLLDKPGEDSYCDSSASTLGPEGHCWFQAFEDQFGRTEIGLHPDGGVPDATNGCIGLQTGDTN